MALIIPFGGKTPRIAPDAFIAPNATLIGDVTIGPGSSVWYGCVLRADYQPITVGARSNIQDGTVIHIDANSYGAAIGDDVLVGHLCLIHACTLENGSFVGNKSCVLDGAVVESGAFVAACALVTPGKRVKSGEMWSGSPARFMRALTDKDRAMITMGPKFYQRYAQEHRAALAAMPSGVLDAAE